jgi:hypothetical protein
MDRYREEGVQREREREREREKIQVITDIPFMYRKRPLGRPRHRWVDNINMDLR